MALSKEQFMELRQQGLSVDQIIKFEKGERPTGVISKRERLERARGYEAETTALREEAGERKALFGRKGMIAQTLSPQAQAKAAYKIGVEAPAKFAVSAAEVPETLITGRAAQREYKLPGLPAFKSYISEAETRATDIIEGRKPLWTAMSPFVEVPLAGLEMALIGKGLIGDVGITGKSYGKITKGFIPQQITRRETGRLAQVVAPAQYKKARITAFEKAGKPGGVKVKGISKKFVYEPTKKDIEVAETVRGIVKSKKNPVKNLERINKRITEVSEKQITPFLKTARVNPKYTAKTLGKTIDDIQPSLSVKSDATLNNIFKNVKRASKDIVLENADDNYRLWRSRIELDNLLEREFPNIFQNPEKATAVKDAYLKIRKSINNFIGVRTIGADKGFISNLRELNNLYTARWNLAEKSYKLLNTSAFKRFFKIHPLIKKITTGAALAGGGAALYRFFPRKPTY